MIASMPYTSQTPPSEFRFLPGQLVKVVAQADDTLPDRFMGRIGVVVGWPVYQEIGDDPEIDPVYEVRHGPAYGEAACTQIYWSDEIRLHTKFLWSRVWCGYCHKRYTITTFDCTINQSSWCATCQKRRRGSPRPWWWVSGTADLPIPGETTAAWEARKRSMLPQVFK